MSECKAIIYHGPGHQSSTRCHNTKKYHKIHEAYYGGYELFVQWKGQQAFTDYFDNPKPLK